MLQPGDRIGDWIVLSPLGAGGMGSIYLTRSVLSERVRAACKVMHARQGAASRDRFIREVDTLAGLNHPAIVRVLSGGDDPERGLLYLFMEYLEGEDLSKRLRRGPLSPAEALNVFRQVASGLQHAHARGVTHRDIKPANIMLTPDGSVKLVDFGVATAEGRTQLTREGTVPGTLPYIDPAAFGGARPDFKRADLYALGVVLWESLTGREAFPEDGQLTDGQQLVRMMRLKLDSEPLDPGPAFPDALRRLCLRATDPDPESRLQSVDAFLEQLNHSFTGRPEISPVSTGEAPLPPPSATASDLWKPKSSPAISKPSNPTSPPSSPANPSRPRSSGGQPLSSPGAQTRPKRARWPWVLLALMTLVGCPISVLVLLALQMASVSEDFSSSIPAISVDSGTASGAGSYNLSAPSAAINPAVAVDATSAATAAIGKSTTFGPYRFKVTGVETKRSLKHNVFSYEAPQGWKLLIVSVSIENTTPSQVTLMNPITVIDRHPLQFQTNVACQLALSDGIQPVVNLEGGQSLRGRVCAEVPDDATGLKLRFQPDMMNVGWNLAVDLGM